MRIKEMILGPNGLLKPEILAAPFLRIHYGVLGDALGLDLSYDYNEVADIRVKAYLVGGSILNSRAHIFRGEVVYVLDGELAAFSWKNCDGCPTRIAFFSNEQAGKMRDLLLVVGPPPWRPQYPVVDIDSEFTPYRTTNPKG